MRSVCHAAPRGIRFKNGFVLQKDLLAHANVSPETQCCAVKRNGKWSVADAETGERALKRARGALCGIAS
jgi:hypothetical protein